MSYLSNSRQSSRIAALAVAALVAAACSSAATPSAPAASTAPPAVSAAPPSTAASAASAPASVAPPSTAASGVAVTAKESEFKIELSATTAPAGSVTFQINNGGTVVHEFVVMKTDLAADKLPVDSSQGVVSEDTAGITVVDEVEDLAVGASASLTVNLPAGHYVVICNVPAHYAGGMHVDFTTN
jgi:uncharacterized cupredoxin-like copper-binding protein